jgi:hypothetical protein
LAGFWELPELNRIASVLPRRNLDCNLAHAFDRDLKGGRGLIPDKPFLERGFVNTIYYTIGSY